MIFKVDDVAHLRESEFAHGRNVQGREFARDDFSAWLGQVATATE